jgi:hypothetical protein
MYVQNSSSYAQREEPVYEEYKVGVRTTTTIVHAARSLCMAAISIVGTQGYLLLIAKACK